MSIIQKILRAIGANSSRYIIWLDATILLILVFFILSGITLVPFHGDEATYIWLSQDYDTLVKEKNFGSFIDPNYEIDMSKQGFRLATGSVLAFSIGFVRDIVGISDKVNNKWIWDDSWNKNIERGDMPTHRLLILARAVAALMGSMSIIFFFWSTLQIFESRLAAWTSTILLATQGAILVSFRRAMQEGPKFFFLTVTLFLASHVLKDLKNNKLRRILYLLMGLTSGLTLAAKQDVAAVLMALYIAVALIPIWNKEKAQIVLINILYLSAATIIAYASFLAVMPIFWGWWKAILMLVGLAILGFQLPTWKSSTQAKNIAFIGCVLIIGMTILSPSLWQNVYFPLAKMTELRKLAVNSQINSLKLYHGFYLDSIKTKAKFFLSNTLTSKVMYMEVQGFGDDAIIEQIKAYEASPIHGRIGSPVLDTLVVSLFIFGCWTLLRCFSAESLLLFSLFVISAAFLFVFVPLPWQRYFLIMQIPYSLIAGVGTETVWNWGRQFARQLIKL